MTGMSRSIVNMLIWFLPLWIAMCGGVGLWAGMKRARKEPTRRRRRIEQYRASPESRILNLRG
jgi:hypothetical protein